MEEIYIEPTAYKAKRRYCDESHTIEVDKGDLISLEEYEGLSFDDQANFEAVYANEKGIDELC